MTGKGRGNEGGTPSINTYGRLVGRLYDHFFGSSFTRTRLRIRRSLATFGARQGGVLHDDSYTELFPKVELSSRSYEVRVIVTPAYSGLHDFDLTASFTALHESFHRFSFPVLHVFSSNLLRRIFSDATLHRCATGDPTFDHWFHVRSLDRFPVGDFLDVPGRRTVFALRYLFARHNIHVTTQGDRVLVRKTLDHHVLMDHRSLEQFWRLARILYWRLERNLRRVFGGQGRRSWSEGHPVTLDLQVPVCLVCGHAIFFNRVHCARCDTAHHGDCWDYVGRCSVYACECRDYRYPRG